MSRPVLGLVASRELRQGPDSLLIRLVREFEPFLREVLQPRIFAVEGTYRALLRHGVLEGYPDLHALPPGRQGGLVALGNLVVGDAQDGSAHDTGVDEVVYLIDSRDATSLFPDSLALKRDCVVTGKPFLATYAAAYEWYALQWYTAGTAPEDAAPAPATGTGEHFLSRSMLQALLPTLEKGVARQRLALIAHDTKKRDILRFADAHFDFLRRFEARQATGTTGGLLNGTIPQRLREAHAELEDERRAFEAVGHVPPRLRRASEQIAELLALAEAMGRRLDGSWVTAQPSGPRGGDVRIADEVRRGRCDKLVFLEDPHVSREHEADIQLLERATRIPGQEVLCLHDMRTATRWAQSWERCLAHNMPAPVTLHQAYRRLWGIDLLLADSGLGEVQPGIETIAVTAARYLYGLVATRAAERRAEGEPARIAVTWGDDAVRIVAAMEAVPDRLRALDCEQPCLVRPLAEDRYCLHANIRVVPILGIVGTDDPRLEANHNALRLGRLFGGDALSLTQRAYHRIVHGQTAWDAADERIPQDWARLDLAILTCERLPTDEADDAQNAIPRALRGKLGPETIGGIGGLYLSEAGAEVAVDGGARIGMPLESLCAVARRGGAVLTVSQASARPQTVLAALNAGLVSALATDRRFAVEVLNTQARRTG